MKTNGKSPYEIRLELLQLANTILTARYTAAPANTSHPPTSEEIIEEAKKLNVFVSNQLNDW